VLAASNYNQPDPANFAAWCGDIDNQGGGVSAGIYFYDARAGGEV